MIQMERFMKSILQVLLQMESFLVNLPMIQAVEILRGPVMVGHISVASVGVSGRLFQRVVPLAIK